MTPRLASVRGIMLAVVVALLPGLLLHAWHLGVVVLLQTGWCVLFALLVEALCLRGRGQSVRAGLGDMSWLVSGVLMGRSLPLLVPLWMMLLATLVALGLVKQASGGLGRNRLNPVMAGLGVIAVCFYQLLYPAPVLSVPWTRSLDIAQVLSQQFQLSPRLLLDGLSGATPLARGEMTAAPYLSWIGYLAGGVGLAMLRVIRLEIPLAMMVSSVVLCMLSGHTLPESLHSLTLGGYLFAAFFIATDPVTSPDTRCGRVLFGLAIGLVTELVREYGLYADGICFAVLTGNLLVPQLDAFSRRLFRPWHAWQKT
ncbi:RnfABCDGE type electron transport complex subunit D [Pseudogulbenkiania subflava]|uniref:Electron transport complex protein RnfD n=1 Tax=Pseudogulbenkiania subflava DSM 22618 TaxID=1123014 RepID=A0A1Y6BZF2_9NEIS|nr:RnfABCDGE type electron transport complex subunit D [Pseudogulbenkiania subflava]SMF37471.1 electron transport complex protein RnfD [Pseudogulbenkiania subflava DSM 22618]